MFYWHPSDNGLSDIIWHSFLHIEDIQSIRTFLNFPLKDDDSTSGLFSWTFSAPFLYVLTNHWISQGFSERQLWNSTKVQILEVLGSIVTEKSQHTIIKFPMCSIVRRSNSYNIHTNAVQFAPTLVTEKKWTIEVAQKKLKSLHWLYFKISAVLFMTINS